jgi:glycosyltransferase involved in cell wall biosynthesis
MNILICCEFYSPSVGGAEKVAEQLAKNFKIYGHNVSIATSKYNKRLPKSEILDKIKIHRFQISGNFTKGLRGNVNEYQKFLISNKYDVILFYAAQQWTLDAALPILDKIKTNIYLATCGFSGLKKIGYKNYFKILKKKLFYFNRNIVHSNNYIDTMFLKKNKIKNKTLIPNAAENIFNKKNNLNFFNLKRIKNAKKNILNISNYKFNKGQDISILVFFFLKYKDKINLIFIGNKFNSKIYFYYIRILKFFTEFFFNNKKILFLEGVSRKNVLSAYSESDIFLFTSRLECSPLVLFESAAAGLPFISLKVGNSYEISRWTKAGVVSDNIFQTAKKLNFFLKNDKYCSILSKNGKNNYIKKFNWKKISIEYLRVFKKYNF